MTSGTDQRSTSTGGEATAADLRWLRRTLTLAARGRGRTSPNPLVGAVVVRDGEVISEGWHRYLGAPHAEAAALAAAGDRARGATLYVNLEPCNHYGRTPPCTEAVMAAGIRRLVACHGDPNPRVEGRGFDRLRAAGVEVVDGFLVEEAVALNWRFLVSNIHRRPGVTIKWAMSLDGKIATASGESQWISSPEGRRWALRERNEHDAILVGSGTVLADDPRLTRRVGGVTEPILRVVMDRRLRTPPEARLFTEAGPVVVYTARDDARAVRELEDAGATVVVLASVTPDQVLADLARRQVQSLLVEGGGTVTSAFVTAGCFDRVAVDVAPRLIGGSGAPGPLGGDGIDSLAASPFLDHLRIRRRGGDLIIEGFRAGCLQDLSGSVAS